jgi:hypothetical protein
VAEGAVLRGSLVIIAKKDLASAAIEVQGNRVEEIRAQLGNSVDVQPEARITLARDRKLLADYEERFPFEMPVGVLRRRYMKTEVGRSYFELRGIVTNGREQCFTSLPVLLTSRDND